jgi:hypothetical protein
VIGSATVQELVGQGGKTTVGSDESNPSLAPRTPPSSKSRDEITEMAKHLARSIVTGYVEHDRGRLDKSAEAFFQVFSNLFPELSPIRSGRAAELYVQVCVKQDEIENHPGHDSTQIMNDPRWETEVRALLSEFSKTLDVPESYADSTMNYYRFHGVRDSRYVNYLLESDRVFNVRVIGDDYWAKILGSLLLILTECHDKHDMKGLEAGMEFATKYYEIILRAKASRIEKTPELVA